MQQKVKKVLDKEGLILTDHNDKLYKHPAHAIHSDCISKISTLATRLQLNPSGRNRNAVTVPQRESHDTPLSRLINRDPVRSA